MKSPSTMHFKTVKKILRYLKDINDYGLCYSFCNKFKLVEYSDSDWAGDLDDRKGTTSFVF